MTLHFRCANCHNLDVFSKEKAKDWKCPWCEYKMIGGIEMIEEDNKQKKDMDEIENIIPPKLPKGLAISLGKKLARFKRECGGVSEDLTSIPPLPKDVEKSLIKKWKEEMLN